LDAIKEATQRELGAPSELAGIAARAEWGTDTRGAALSAGREAPSPDEEGFRRWAVVRLPGLRRRAHLLTGEWGAADDLVQETLIKLYANWPRVAGGPNPDAYAAKVLATRYLDQLRKPWRRSEVSTPRPPDYADARVEAAFENVERDDILMTALGSLPRDQRIAIVFRYSEDMSLEQIANVLDVPLGTVKSRLSRASAQLRRELVRQGYEAPRTDQASNDSDEE
jgi:RNA polymerase sigma-70 factor (sigma-E family)